MFRFWRRKKEEAQPLSHISSDFRVRALNLTKHTPDVSYIQSKWVHLLFVYDGYQPGYPKHSAIDEAIHYGTAFTVDRFTMFKKRLGHESFPLAFDTEFKEELLGYRFIERYPVKGALMIARPRVILDLDERMSNMVMFERRLVTVNVPNRRLLAPKPGGKPTLTGILNETVPALMYVARLPYWIEQMDMGYMFQPLPPVKPKTYNRMLPAYRHFTLDDYKE